MKRFLLFSATILSLFMFSCEEDSDDDGDRGGSGVGLATVWVQSDFGCGNITVNVGGITKVITAYYSEGSPGCDADGCANYTLTPGTYSMSASCTDSTWSGTITVTEDGCSTMQLTE